jgi:hypothetical protein
MHIAVDCVTQYEYLGLPSANWCILTLAFAYASSLCALRPLALKTQRIPVLLALSRYLLVLHSLACCKSGREAD